MSHPLIFLDFITRTVLGEEYRSLSSSLCSFLHSTVTSSWKISTFCPNNVSPCFLMYLSVNSDYFNTEHRHLRWHHGRQYVYFRRHVVVWRGSVKTPDVLKLGVCVCVCLYIYRWCGQCSLILRPLYLLRRCADVARRNWFQIPYTKYFELLTLVMWARGSVVGWGIVLQARRSRVRFPVVSILAALRPRVDSASNRNEYQDYFLVV